ncbi:AQG_2a_G0047800.mRNA.1.CDS.1 [Saccharomyces cerevisiae]|uniref:Protein MSO1 n=6 Tax=Saccharomyces TaxID=4930 RepID=MSO1_YEAST|nr:Mso1p [Saccharomyces cerevisiae S288C]P53604.1 RecName: Full=Protein MSO1 [Saccharomyces cerevisiae S288C]AAB01212.1 Mso1p [Saccharomyces cerevisiae]AJT01808.1 Mso1p [Saccharomyces cerevisiae YJM189]AJT03669.1 Mso1p [Saccharomyces cerevisiae YJM270]AJT04041.1 Mso1p [Saccharomyces cerevisiae YJM271]AJT05916.1 Mso1p [Saccharomyces cerevisiae YJM451]AJT07768.1 Mso1p [Saccharomyces cerevisiae YJM554]AJT08144.1 Mso1p [Saccharomyces cerevisiae YJM555]AJT08886.1 Mso1p [Saccharomyces cerevisiae|eukprot:NP_014447.3 Mso1p [Saccharomyces cerevisiae S288C]
MMSQVSHSQEGSGRFWNKFKSSTKSLSTSLAHLSIKAEKDGDTVNTTLVHKGLVKFYENQHPFQGFPGWLGEKEDLPNERKILDTQVKHDMKKQNSRHFSPSFSNRRKASSEDPMGTPSSNGNTPEYTPASKSFQDIYNNHTSSSSATPRRASSRPTRPSAGQEFRASLGRSKTSNSFNTSSTPTPPPDASSGVMAMKDRLKRRNNDYGF